MAVNREKYTQSTWYTQMAALIAAYTEKRETMGAVGQPEQPIKETEATDNTFQLDFVLEIGAVMTIDGGRPDWRPHRKKGDRWGLGNNQSDL